MKMSSFWRRCGGAQRGQMLVITALMAIVIVGAAALAVDLSTQRNSHRFQLNWGDTASISAVRECASACDAKKQVQDALQILLQNSPWSGTASWATPALPGCSSSTCVLANYQGPTGFANYKFSISSPPSNPNNASYNTVHYVEVDVTQLLNTNFGGLIGAPTTTAVSHSIAYSAGPPGPLPYAFFSKTHAGSGNQQETISADTFLGDGDHPASSGLAGLCVLELASDGGTSNNDGDGSSMDNDLDDQGHVVFGGWPPAATYPQTLPSGEHS